ncbi:hypothetical protein [Mycobacterium sp. P7213]|uniref:hypothetical protein n=1 Tax=Mycobacterium sp. P7213 TaxID=2478465 RepID=UPI000F6420F6|nr:hypothetical protein [Mycobacterium sp. P7213]
MAYKLTCPGCDRYTSAVFTAYSDGLPCPYCGSGLQASSSQYYRQLHYPLASTGPRPVAELSLLWQTATQLDTVMVGIDTRELTHTLWQGDTVAIDGARYTVLGIDMTRKLTHPPTVNPIVGLWLRPLASASCYPLGSNCTSRGAQHHNCP